MLPFARRRVSSYYGHAGAIFYESKYVWGAAQIENFDHCVPRNLTACRRLNISSDTCDTVNPYIRHHYYGSVEMAVLMLQHWRYFGSVTHAKLHLLPLADEVLRFYFEHWPVVNGTLLLLDAQGGESIPNCTNPAPDIAGLTALLGGMLKHLPAELLPAATRARYQAMMRQLPPLPRNGNTLAACSEQNSPAIEGCEGLSECKTPTLSIWPASLANLESTRMLQMRSGPLACSPPPPQTEASLRWPTAPSAAAASCKASRHDTAPCLSALPPPPWAKRRPPAR